MYKIDTIWTHFLCLGGFIHTASRAENREEEEEEKEEIQNRVREHRRDTRGTSDTAGATEVWGNNCLSDHRFSEIKF